MLEKINLLAHSGFLVELPKAWLVFDYFQDPTQVLASLPKTAKPVLFMVTHFHHDHFNPVIFDLPADFDLPDVHYILDSTCFTAATEDIQEVFHSLGSQNQLTWIQPGDVLGEAVLARFGLRQLRVTGSTDAGSSLLLLTQEDEILFFAGDLNDWDWQDEDSPKMAEAFATELGKLKQSLTALVGGARQTFVAKEQDPFVDWAFFPLDKRLGDKAEQGPLKFIQAIRPRHFIPMHLIEGFTLPSALQAKTDVEVLQDLLRPGDVHFCTGK